MQTSALFGAKNFGFFEIYGVFTWTRGLSQDGHFADKREGSVFRDFVRTSFMDGRIPQIVTRQQLLSYRIGQ